MLKIKNLSIAFKGVFVLEKVSFSLGQEKLAIVGESGSGKTLLAKAIMGLLPSNSCLSYDECVFKDKLLEPKKTRGKDIGLIFQDPKSALNPTMTIGAQMDEMFLVHEKLSASDAKMKTLEALVKVLIEDPKRVYSSYPHQISGGMAQRVFTAMVTAPKLSLLIADEPTSALDADNRHAFLRLCQELVDHKKMGLILISHDLSLVSQFCDWILILRKGKVIELIKAQDLEFSNHPYTRCLLSCVPRGGVKRLPTCLA